jgi:hypothetical protein
MKETYFERPQQPICKSSEIQWAEPEQWQDETTGAILFCWPGTSEAQMWEQARCRECNQPARWVGIGSPFGDGEQFYLASQAWCYWCLPREHFTDTELQLVRHAEWARQKTVGEILETIRDVRLQTDNNTVESALSDLADQISERMFAGEKRMETDSSKQQVIKSPEEVAAFLSDMSLDEWRKATSLEKRKACPDSEGLTTYAHANERR